jgi:hypothetical protein
VPPHRSVGKSTSDLREQLTERLRPRGMPVTGQHPRIIHDTQHAPSLARREPPITQPRRITSLLAVVVLVHNCNTPEDTNGADVVLSGHGSFESANGMIKVPEGISVSTYVPHDSYLLDRVGNDIELGNPPAPTRVYGPGDEMPNYTLHSPNGLRIMGNPITVSEDTLLNDLLTRDMGMVHWAACTEAC